jgi:hypothetical protein
MRKRGWGDQKNRISGNGGECYLYEQAAGVPEEKE